MRIVFITLSCLSVIHGGGRGSSGKENDKDGATEKPTRHLCQNVFNECYQSINWTSCYEKLISTCDRKGRFFMPNFIHRRVKVSEQADESPTEMHRVHIPSSALQKSKGGGSQEEEVVLVTTVFKSTYFMLSPSQRKRSRSRSGFTPNLPVHSQGSPLGGLVLFVRAGSHPVKDLSQPIKLTFQHDRQAKSGICVSWQELQNRTGQWITDGCDTSESGDTFVCNCNHLSFFAVLVNPVLSVDEANSTNLSYITYIGSALSVFFTVISLIIYLCLQRRRPEKAISVHMQLTGALLCLHLSFLLCSFWVWHLSETEEGWVCRFLGFFLHWSLLATLCWTAVEGFHLYLLLVQVFNIYVRRYVLKLSLVGWGLPTLIAVVCGIAGVYGKDSLQHKDSGNQNSTSQICWMSKDFPQRLVVSFITTVAFPCLVVLCNSCMMGLVLFKLWHVRGDTGWKQEKGEKRARLWKDCATVLGLSCVLGLPWGLAGSTYMSLPGIYLFTILNSLQGVFMFLWSVALLCKSRSDHNSSIKDPSSSQKMMTTSFNN
ncbi:adhesion G protein-coupled receptor G3-like [Solea senegalensis]|uniref:Adhesion G protein-coupled receptor G3-like n=2 Tax=Solea senegalensis TaxID=28829 RepID=A0AAV6Q6G9_SOLSE|nr:adhesion G protein-coupled receptor G3-like isoform X1 [Solea senegalensis]KAG7482469.1 adhesion G protein-coupled receptor G3-like [Solea senegalensis]